MPTKAQLSAHAIEDARHLEVVGVFYQTDNEALLGPVLAELRPRLAAFLHSKKVVNQELLADIVQDALEQILLGLRKRQFGARGKLSSWAMQIAWLTYADALESKKGRPSRPGSFEDPFLLIIEKSTCSADELVANGEEEARASALIKGATRVVLGLDINARNAVLAYFYYGHSQPEAAAHLGITMGRFLVRLGRGLTALREWGAQQQAPTAELYEALSRVDTGDLFRQPGRKTTT
jgi:RNA polymerase sigma factor (sigma-70 family)